MLSKLDVDAAIGKTQVLQAFCSANVALSLRFCPCNAFQAAQRVRVVYTVTELPSEGVQMMISVKGKSQKAEVDRPEVILFDNRLIMSKQATLHTLPNGFLT